MMTIPISSSYTRTASQWLGTPTRNQTATSNPARALSAGSDAIDISVSPVSELLADLVQLAESDPDRFRQISGEISDALSSAAQQNTAGQSDALQSLSEEFANASRTGSISALLPQQRAALAENPYTASSGTTGLADLLSLVGGSVASAGSAGQSSGQKAFSQIPPS